MAKQTMTFTAEFEVPEGYELTGEFRVPRKDEYFVNSNGKLEQQWAGLIDQPRAILRPAPKWRPATVEDAARAILGATVKARGQFGVVPVPSGWEEFELVGYDRSETNKWIGPNKTYRICEVLDV